MSPSASPGPVARFNPNGDFMDQARIRQCASQLRRISLAIETHERALNHACEAFAAVLEAVFAGALQDHRYNAVATDLKFSHADFREDTHPFELLPHLGCFMEAVERLGLVYPSQPGDLARVLEGTGTRIGLLESCEYEMRKWLRQALPALADILEESAKAAEEPPNGEGKGDLAKREALLPDKERKILAALNGRIMTADELAQATDIERSDLFRIPGLRSLRKKGLIDNMKGKGGTGGYYRPDAPPDDFGD